MPCHSCQPSPDHSATRAAMCAACPAANPTLTHCTVDGGRLWGRVECPLGRYPDAEGVVRWWRARWHGVPMPLRLWLILRGRSASGRPEEFAGCGCLVRAKEWLQRLGKTT